MDTHCHLFLIEDEPAAVTAAARAAGVGRMICVGIDPESSRRSLELAESLRGVFATAGMHPHHASTFDRAAGSAIEELLLDPLVVGVGETGLDYYRTLSPAEDQQRAFRTHIALSRESGKPLVVHVRDAWDDAMRILAEERAERVVLHCFSGDADGGRGGGGARVLPFVLRQRHVPQDGRHRGSAAASVAEDRLWSRPTARSCRRSRCADARTHPRTR